MLLWFIYFGFSIFGIMGIVVCSFFFIISLVGFLFVVLIGVLWYDSNVLKILFWWRICFEIFMVFFVFLLDCG